MAISRLNLGTTNQVLVKAAAGQTSNLLELQNSSGTVVAGLNQDGVWSGTAEPGLVLLNTTSFSAVASQSVNDIFSATYDNYKILIEIDSTSVGSMGINMRLRVGGADNSSANYWNNRVFGQSATVVSGGNTTPDTSFLNVQEYDNVGISTFSYDLFAPFRTATTTLIGVGQFRYTGFYQHTEMKSGQTTVTTSYTGFTLIPGSGTMTGKVRIYGYNQ